MRGPGNGFRRTGACIMAPGPLTSRCRAPGVGVHRRPGSPESPKAVAIQTLRGDPSLNQMTRDHLLSMVAEGDDSSRPEPIVQDPARLGRGLGSLDWQNRRTKRLVRIEHALVRGGRLLDRLEFLRGRMIGI